MLHEFLIEHRSALIERCRLKVARRRGEDTADAELAQGIPIFLEQLTQTLLEERSAAVAHAAGAPDVPGGDGHNAARMAKTAARHGLDLLARGSTVDEVVHDYGDVCQTVTEMAVELDVRVDTKAFQTLNRCLDDAIAEAVTGYCRGRESLLAERSARSLNERLGILAHELRNLVHTANLAFSAIKTGSIGAGGATGALVDRSFSGLTRLIDRTLEDVRAAAGKPALPGLLSVAAFIEDVAFAAALEARARDCRLIVSPVDPLLAIDVERDLLTSAVQNLLQNAFKFTKTKSAVMLRAYGLADRVRIDVEDRCGGLPPEFAGSMFLPFTQAGADKSGVGLGLAISRRSVVANKGILDVHDLPGVGCVFSIDLPRHEWRSGAGTTPLR